jgi:hypothetical protein
VKETYYAEGYMTHYHYNSLHNLSPQELFLWVFMDQTTEQIGADNMTAVFNLLAGLPVLQTKGNSSSTVGARQLLNYKIKTRLPALTKESIDELKLRFTTNLAAFVGRTVPVVGWVILAHDVMRIAAKTVSKYNALASAEDQIS